MLLGLLPVTSGTILFKAVIYWNALAPTDLLCGREMQVVFQDPYASLNARLTVRETLTEGMMIHQLGADPKEREVRAGQLLSQVDCRRRPLTVTHMSFPGGSDSASLSPVPYPLAPISLF